MTEQRSLPKVTGKRTSVIGAVVSGLAAYGFTIIGARTVGDVGYAPVGVLWTVQYLVLTVGLLSVEAWVTREGSVPRTAWWWIGGLAAALGVGAHVAGPAMLGSSDPAWTTTAVLIGLGFGAFAVARGLAAAIGDLHSYGMMTGGESLLRLMVLMALLPLAPTAQAVALTLPVGALAVSVGYLFGPGRRRSPEGARIASPNGPLSPGVTHPPDSAGRFLASTTTANAALQLLLAGGPLLSAGLGANPSLTSAVFVTTTAARAPLVLVYSGLLSRLLAAVRRSSPSDVARHARRVVLLAPLVVAASGGVGVALGPPLVALAFGAPLRPSGAFAGLTAAAVVAAILLLSGNQLLIAQRASDRLWVPWIVAVVVAAVVAVSTSSATPDLRAGLVTLAGLLTAGAMLAVAVLRESGRAAAG